MFRMQCQVCTVKRENSVCPPDYPFTPYLKTSREVTMKLNKWISTIKLFLVSVTHCPDPHAIFLLWLQNCGDRVQTELALVGF